jgi:hypothetical protein
MTILKNTISAIIFIGLTLFTNAQTVDSIKVEQAGDKILIHYRILQSNELQVFKVTLSCFTSTGLKLEPKSLSGDFGDNITGGRADYLIVWDVLKDMEELQSAEFSVKAELVKGKATFTKGPNLTGWDKKRFHLMLAGDYPGPKLGIGIGYNGSFGISATLIRGKTGIDSHWENDPEVYQSKVWCLHIDFSKRIVNRSHNQIHLITGIASTNILRYDTSIPKTYLKQTTGLDLGILFDIKRIAFSIGATAFIHKDDSDFIHVVTPDQFLRLGFGVRF